jgi:UDP-glucose 4-epimerase
MIIYITYRSDRIFLNSSRKIFGKYRLTKYTILIFIETFCKFISFIKGNQYLEKNAKSLGISSICFRFFNIGGALQTTKGNWLKIKHEGATHLIPSILHSSTEKPLLIFGNDWATKDGTPTRDFVHVVDLADALIKSLTKLEVAGNQVINLGTSTGSTVLEVVKTAETSLKKNISYKFADRRAGDSFALVTSNEKAKQVLGWTPTKSLSDILQDAQSELLANH